ncbi:LptF/LptG family permease [Shimia thalassica]|uniref:LptF/LptG family permease n=1 Tax=Shimia thalassica TaxID=1715693 RepID=UPI0024947E53|nr:LptF/LptG family permease [Shimia thalassica]
MGILRKHTGIAARRVFATYLLAISFSMFVLLVIALAIDLASHLDDVRAKADDTGASTSALLLPYMGYRAADIITRLLPMACLIGGLIAELLRRQRLEDVILDAAGASPSITLGALLAVGLVTGIAQTALEGSIRPHAVANQVKLGLGSYAERFKSGETAPVWFLDGNRAMQAKVYRADAPELRDVRLYDGLTESSLTSITHATRAIPVEGNQMWRLEGIVRWQIKDGYPQSPERLAQMDIAFPLTSAHVQYHGVLGFYLPYERLQELSSIAASHRSPDAETAIVRRYAAFFLPGIFALLGASLARVSQRGRVLAPFRLLMLGTMGYLSLVSVKVFWALGEFGEVGPIATSVIPLTIALGVSILLQLIASGYVVLRRPEA